MRSAGSPTSTATAAPTRTPSVTATPHGRSWMPNAPSLPTSFTVVSPPTAAKPNWPSDSCPAQPVRMVSEHPATANTSTRVQRNDSDAREKKIGISTSTPNSVEHAAAPRWRDHHGAAASHARAPG